MKNTIVLGIGNPLMCDEGIGIRVIEELQSASGNFPEADFLDAGTGGIAMVHRLEGYKKAILIDCALMGQQPGTIKRFTPDDVTSVKQLAHLSLHEADIISVLELALAVVINAHINPACGFVSRLSRTGHLDFVAPVKHPDQLVLLCLILPLVESISVDLDQVMIENFLGHHITPLPDPIYISESNA
jgi:hydrogenase maturation protease